ncbi:DNA-dependent ATPase mgs1 [Entomophthora muscae]|nr:DNA-dependent ATPase mgs1 [Entomophthora muscae]
MIAQEISPNVSTFNLLLELSTRNGVYVEYLSMLAKSMGIQFNALSREIIIRGMLQRGEYTMLLNTWEQWLRDPQISSTVTPLTLQLVIMAYARSGYSNAALTLLQDPGTRAISSPTPKWLMSLLRIFIRNQYANGAFFLLSKVMNAKVLPDEGACIEGLNVAAKVGHSEFTSLLVQVLGALKVELKDWHFVPIIQAYLKSPSENDWRRAIHVTRVMSSGGVSLESYSISPPLVAHFADNLHLARSLEECLKGAQYPYIILWNILIEAYIKTGQLEAATALFRYVCDSSIEHVIPGLVPDIETFDIMFKGAVTAGLPKLANQVETIMPQFDIPLSLTSYSSLIQLELTKLEYDSAFFYLESMQSMGIKPSREIYSAIITRCAKERDPRAYVALEEMESFGYQAGSYLRRMIETGGVAPSKIKLNFNKFSHIKPSPE